MIPKFRAWKKVGTPEMFNDVRAIDFDKGIVKLGYRLSKDTVRIDKEKLNKMILMQSTGIKDKNGVEIFEGDIVNVHEFINVGGIEGYEEGEREIIGVVEYGCIFYSPIPEWYLENSDDYIPFSYIGLHDESFEVLGNIYEHPHLLEE